MLSIDNDDYIYDLIKDIKINDNYLDDLLNVYFMVILLITLIFFYVVIILPL